ncbi:hypothetical protein Tco_0993269 [Tanacetum coccineum]|uniref:Uncharacterized protein n=1 Tax=Tanacetum coccineum TaxID=301880 RepID=A0ABQ5F5Q9_9ASTR
MPCDTRKSNFWRDPVPLVINMYADVKKQNCTVMSSAEAAYGRYLQLCSVMWMRNTASRYGFNYNKDTGCISDSHSAIKRYLIATPDNIREQKPGIPIADMFTKALPDDRVKPLILQASDTSIQPNPEQMDEEFTTTAYPNVQENLKLPTEGEVRLEEPASLAGTLSSLQNLDKELSFTNQFLAEKSQED